MEKVKIVTDSTCYLSKDIIDRYDVKIVPLYVRFGEKTYRENIDMKGDECYRRIENGELPGTTQPTAHDFIKIYKPLVEKGYSIISPLISSKISGAVNAANAAKESLGSSDIYIFDSEFTTSGLGYQVLEIAKRLYDQGICKDEVINEMPSIRSRMNNFFIVGDLYFLARLGRIKKTEAVLGSMVKIKPLLYLHEGRIDTLEKPRTIKKVKLRMLELSKQIISKIGLKYMSIIWGDNRAETEEYRNICEKEFDRKISLTRLGPVIGTHTGPNVLSLQFCSET